MDTQTIAIVFALLVQTAALAFTGGKLWQIVRSHDRYLYGPNGLSVWKHDEVTPRLFKVDELWRTHEGKEG